MPVSMAITRITRPRTRPVAGARTMPGSADTDLPPAQIHTRILPHSGLSRRATPMFAGLRPVDSTITPHAPAGRRQSWIASTASPGLEGQRNSSESSSLLPLLVPSGKVESYNGLLEGQLFFSNLCSCLSLSNCIRMHYSSSTVVSSACCGCFSLSRNSLPFPRASVTSFQSFLDSANTPSFPS
jgi:hypothetical protein